MARSAAIPDVPRKRGNPNWGQPMRPAAVLATEFELQVRKLHLTREKYVFSVELKAWCEQHRNRVYIPEWLLEAWDIIVDPNVAMQRNHLPSITYHPPRTQLRKPNSPKPQLAAAVKLLSPSSQ